MQKKLKVKIENEKPTAKEEINEEKVKEQLAIIQEAAIQNENMFEQLMETCKYASLGQITRALFEVGGQYRRNM